MNEKLKHKEIWSGIHKGIGYEIVKWYSEGVGIIYNTYIYIKKSTLSDIDFKKLNLRGYKFQLPELCPVIIMYNYSKLENYFQMSGGITFYEKIYNNEGKIVGVKIGNDYAHIWNTGNENHQEDVENSIDEFLKNFNLINK